MQLPVTPPISPMLAKSVAVIPPGACYEPKWDGFRSICFRADDQIELGSRNERPLTRYFPELVAAAASELPRRCVIDGEIIIATERGLDFEAL
ncbi:MAG: ATP-dependent DNA ligase, partial [Mycobacteriaceae bacterium]|nr:ATP-dependent DNA ligase [Mycobacteriaceae bacterium]